MSVISASWLENQSITFDDATPAKGVEGKGDIDLATNGYIAVDIQIEVAFGATADGNATLSLRGSPDSGTTKDTEPFFQEEIFVSPNNTVRISKVIRGKAYVEVGIKNNNTVVEDITISAKYAGLRYSVA